MYVYILSIVYLDIYISLHLSNLSYLTYTNLYLHIYVSIWTIKDCANPPKFADRGVVSSLPSPLNKN